MKFLISQLLDFFKAKKYLGATDENGSLMFLIKWENSEITELVPAKEANIKCPQVKSTLINKR